MKTFVEIKQRNADSGFMFSDRETGLIRQTSTGDLSRAQVSKYAAEIMRCQHRTHVFSIFISGGYARILRWDHSGCIVTKPIDLRTKWRQLYNYVYRFAKLSPEQQGYDPTVQLAEEADIAKLRAYTTSNLGLRRCRDMMLRDTLDYPIHKVFLNHTFFCLYFCEAYIALGIGGTST